MAGPVARLESNGNGEKIFTIPYRGDSEQSSDFLEALVRGGVRVASFGKRREGLEELFLKVGAKELS